MVIDDNGEFRRRLITLAELFDLKLAPTRQALYFEALRDLPFEDVAKALNQAAKSCTFFPRLAELRAFAVGDAEDRVEAAWMIFRAALGRVGAYSSLAVADPVLGETITAVFQSWPEACASELTPEMWSSKRKEFGRVYRVINQRQLVGPRYLPGICERQNAGKLDWQRFIPVALLEGDGAIRRLSEGDADTYRTQLAERTHGFARLRDRVDHLLPVQDTETA